MVHVVEGNINRQALARYDVEALVHVYAYRALVAYSFIYALIVLLNLLGLVNGILLKIGNIVLWVIAAPLVYAFSKGLALVMSRGLVHGHLQSHLRDLLARGKGMLGVYKAMPYLATALWVIGLILYLVLGW